MKRVNLNFLVDIIGFIGFVFLTSTGVLMRYVLPPGIGRFSTILDLDRHQWGAIHFWVSVGFFTVLALHLLLHWRWVMSLVTGRPREGSGFRVGLGIVGVVTLITLALTPLITPVEKSSSRVQGEFAVPQRNDVALIRSSMTLQEIEDASGVPVAYILETLNLPKNVPTNERIGRLKSRYGFEINDLRQVVKDYKPEQPLSDKG